MNLTQAQIESLQEDMTADLMGMLIEKRGMTFQEATTTLYNSDTYEKLQDVDTGFYYQSPGYVYAFLENELTTGKCC